MLAFYRVLYLHPRRLGCEVYTPLGCSFQRQVTLQASRYGGRPLPRVRQSQRPRWQIQCQWPHISKANDPRPPWLTSPLCKPTTTPPTADESQCTQNNWFKPESPNSVVKLQICPVFCFVLFFICLLVFPCSLFKLYNLWHCAVFLSVSE